MSSHPLTLAAPGEALGQLRAPDLRVLELVTMKAWDRLLFVECGDGWLVEEAWRRLGRGCVWGLSTSPRLVDVAARLRGVPGRVEFQGWDGEHFPLTTQSFDRVISCVPTGCYAEPLAALREMARVLHPNGDAYLLESEDGGSEHDPLLESAGFCEVRRHYCDATVIVIHARATLSARELEK